ncbi:hypothetical protein M3221_16800 [Domibacillus indicus]|uniref:Y-family DNA polymerase n=1 Tax=Domibacillus indicus TaxID=1437523 RepID=UPI00203BAC9F|nr:hypothetical protein [Domibacillus indicus]MCM3790048.1 hypothetical protein [Domibacillus indicus]
MADKFTIARTIQRTVWQELRLVVTIGIGDNPLLAKLVLDNEGKNAPNGISYWSYEDVPTKVWAIIYTCRHMYVPVFKKQKGRR